MSYIFNIFNIFNRILTRTGASLLKKVVAQGTNEIRKVLVVK
jgi:hypothetical protein